MSAAVSENVGSVVNPGRSSRRDVLNFASVNFFGRRRQRLFYGTPFLRVDCKSCSSVRVVHSQTGFHFLVHFAIIICFVIVQTTRGHDVSDGIFKLASDLISFRLFCSVKRRRERERVTDPKPCKDPSSAGGREGRREDLKSSTVGLRISSLSNRRSRGRSRSPPSFLPSLTCLLDCMSAALMLLPEKVTGKEIAPSYATNNKSVDRFF